MRVCLKGGIGVVLSDFPAGNQIAGVKSPQADFPFRGCWKKSDDLSNPGCVERYQHETDDWLKRIRESRTSEQIVLSQQTGLKVDANPFEKISIDRSIISIFFFSSFSFLFFFLQNFNQECQKIFFFFLIARQIPYDPFHSEGGLDKVLLSSFFDEITPIALNILNDVVQALEKPKKWTIHPFKNGFKGNMMEARRLVSFLPVVLRHFLRDGWILILLFYFILV